MTDKIKRILFYVNIFQVVLYLFGFVNRVLVQTGNTPLVNVATLYLNFWGILFWSVLSMICVIGLTMAVYVLLSNRPISVNDIGVILTALGYVTPVIFSFFLIIPATILVMGTLFIKIEK